MPRISLTINQVPYDVVCGGDDGVVERLRLMAGRLDDCARQIALRHPMIDQPRLLLLAGLMLADDLAATAPAGMAEALDMMAQRIEAIAVRLEEH